MAETIVYESENQLGVGSSIATIWGNHQNFKSGSEWKCFHLIAIGIVCEEEWQNQGWKVWTAWEKNEYSTNSTIARITIQKSRCWLIEPQGLLQQRSAGSRKMMGELEFTVDLIVKCRYIKCKLPKIPYPLRKVWTFYLWEPTVLISFQTKAWCTCLIKQMWSANVTTHFRRRPHLPHSSIILEIISWVPFSATKLCFSVLNAITFWHLIP